MLNNVCKLATIGIITFETNHNRAHACAGEDLCLTFAQVMPKELKRAIVALNDGTIEKVLLYDDIKWSFNCLGKHDQAG